MIFKGSKFLVVWRTGNELIWFLKLKIFLPMKFRGKLVAIWNWVFFCFKHNRFVMISHKVVSILYNFPFPVLPGLSTKGHSCVFPYHLLSETICFCFCFLQASSGNYYFIPYTVTPCADYFCCESDAQRRASEYMQPNWDTILGPLCMPLVDRFTSLLKDIRVTSW